MSINTQELAKLVGLKPELLQGIRELSAISSQVDAPPLDAIKLASIQNTVVSLFGDTASNNGLKKMLSEYEKFETGIRSIDAHHLITLSFRTRNLSKIQPHLDKVFDDFSSVIEGKELKSSDKISLEQFGTLHDLSALNETMFFYRDLGIIKGNPQLERLFNDTCSAKDIITHLDKTFEQKFRMPTGSIVFDHTKSKAAIANHQLSLMERIVDQKTKYGHSSKGLSVDVVVKGMPKIVTKISHINPNYKEENFSLRNYLYSDIYKLNLIKLITPANQDVLKKHLGVNWLEILQNKYSAIERQLHDEAMEAHAGIIAEGGMLRFARTAMTPFSQNLVSDDHSDASIHEEIFRRNKWEKMGGDRKLLCSEFVGKTLIASIYELNDGLIRELGEQGIKVKKLLNSPIDQKETLSILTPERLLTCLKKNGVVEMVAPISELSQFIVKGGDETAGVSMKAALQAQKSVFLASANSMSDDESPENGDQKQNNSRT